MKRRLFLSIFVLILLSLSLTLFGCTIKFKPDRKGEWEYSKAEMAKFAEGNVILTSDQDIQHLSFSLKNSFFKEEISAENILLFNLSEIGEVRDYIKYDDIKSHLVEFNNFELSLDYMSFSIDFVGEANSSYGVLVHKKVIENNNYAIAFASTLGGKIITEYEESIIKQKGKWDDANRAIQVASYLSQIVLSFMSDQTIPFAGGIFGLASTLGPLFFSSGASLDSIAKQLDVIDGKIDALNAQIDANQKEILDQLVQTQAMIDEVKVIGYNQNITAYQTDYVKPLTDYIMIYKDMVEQAMKKYVAEGHTVSVYYGKSSYAENDLIFSSEQDVSTAQKVDVVINNFNNALAYLANNRNIVGDGLPQAINKDIQEAIKNVSLPNGKSKDAFIEDIYKTICDNINTECLSKEDATLHRDVLQFINNFISYAKALAGVNFESVINSYISRLEYIYNFSIEIKPVVIDLLASIKTSLDYYVCLAQSACIAQEINAVKEIADAYDLACEYILNVYNAQMAMPDNYCYPIKQKVGGNLYNAICEVSFTNLGNHPDFHASFVLKKNIGFDGSKISGNAVDVNSISFVKFQEVRAIVTRYNLLRSAGVTKEDIFITYLKSVGIVSAKDLDTINSLFNGGRTTFRYGQILTSYSIRDLTNSDSVTMHCQCYGNPGGSYFSVGHEYPYRFDNGTIEAQYWSGKIAVGDLLDSSTGLLESDKKISAYAKYSESHMLWIDDEHWGFIDDIFGLFCFIITKQ